MWLLFELKKLKGGGEGGGLTFDLLSPYIEMKINHYAVGNAHNKTTQDKACYTQHPNTLHNGYILLGEQPSPNIILPCCF